MFKKAIFSIGVLIFMHGAANAGLFDQLQKMGNKMQGKNGSVETSGQGANIGGNSTNDNKNADQICTLNFGANYKGAYPEGKSAEDLVGQYFKGSADLSKKLSAGLATMHKGSMLNMRLLVTDLHDEKVLILARTFLDDPNTQNLGFIVALAQNGDGYKPQNGGPSERTEAKTLLALTLLQYPDLALDKGQAVALLKEGFIEESGLSIALLARFHLFGDYLNQDLSAFDNYLGQSSMNYPVKLADQTVFFALKNIPNWKQKRQYEDLMRQSAGMQASFQKQQGAINASADLRQRVISLMQEGERINDLTLEALGAGPLVAKIRARGERMKVEAGGKANLLEVYVTTQAAYQEEANALLSTSPVIDNTAKEKLKQANDLRIKNISATYAVAGQVAMLMFSGNINETIEIGGAVNQYFADSCKATLRMAQYSRQSGIPESLTTIDPKSEL